MPSPTRRVLQIFLASPGDLQTERRTTRNVVDDINHGLARELGWHIDLVGWEETLPGYSRPQERINPEVETCDLFIGLLHEGWGTPTGSFSSGFEEEFEIARARRERSGSAPEIWLFFKSMEPKLVRDPGEDAKRVLAFRAKTIAEKKLLFREFNNSEEWARTLWQTLTTELTRRARAAGDFLESSRATELPEPAAPATAGLDGEIETKESAGALTRLTDAVRDAARALEVDDVAGFAKGVVSLVRVNLFTAATLARFQTSETYGPHETNLAYRHRERIDLVESDVDEASFILRTLLTGADNVAGWFWLHDFPVGSMLAEIAVYARRDSQEPVRRGAIRLLRGVGRLPAGTDPTTFLTSVLADRSAGVRREALRLLEEVAPDVPGVMEILDEVASSNDQIAGAAAEILSRMQAASDPEKTFAALLSRDERVSPAVLSALSDRADLISTVTLQMALASPRPELRVVAIQALALRGELTPSVARTLLTDGAGAVREAIVAVGFDGFTRADLELALRDVPPELPGSNRFDLEESMRLAYCRRISSEELRSNVDWLSLDGHAAYEVLATEHFADFKDELRGDLRDNFEGLKTRSLRSAVPTGDQEKVDALANQVAKVDKFIRSGYIVAALRGLLANGTRRDADLVRSYLDGSGYGVKDAALAVLMKMASPEDASLLEDAALTEPVAEARTQLAQAALIAVARKDLPGLRERFLSSGKADLVRLALSVRVTPSDRRQLTERAVQLTYVDDPPSRLEAVRYLATVLSRQRVEAFLQQYVQADRYFYNVVCWIDRVLYAPGEFAEAYERELENLGT
jgi:hypothetical protein